MLAPDLTAYFAPPPAVPMAGAELSIPERMAIVIRELRGDRPEPDCEGVTFDEFVAHPLTCDLTRDELRANTGKAAQLLQQPHDPLAAWDSDSMLNRMVAIACAAFPTEGEVFRALRDAGYSNAAIAGYWLRIMASTAEAVRTARLPQVS